MFNPLKGLGDLNEMRKKAAAMQQALSVEEVTVEKNGVKIIMSGDQKVKEVTVDGKNERRIAQAIEEALKQTQQIAARKLMSMQ